MPTSHQSVSPDKARHPAGSIAERATMQQKVHYQVALSTTSTVTGEGKLLDLSIDGCRIEHARHLSINNYLSLRLTLAVNDPPILVDLAAVRWVRDKECGIQFLSLQPAQLLRLHKFLASAEKLELPPLPNDQ